MNEWIELPGFPGYTATADGRVHSPRGKELKPFTNHRGSFVNLYRDGELVRRGIETIKRMVAQAMERAA